MLLSFDNLPPLNLNTLVYYGLDKKGDTMFYDTKAQAIEYLSTQKHIFSDCIGQFWQWEWYKAAPGVPAEIVRHDVHITMKGGYYTTNAKPHLMRRETDK